VMPGEGRHDGVDFIPLISSSPVTHWTNFYTGSS
jgi:hypothetical protein